MTGQKPNPSGQIQYTALVDMGPFSKLIGYWFKARYPFKQGTQIQAKQLNSKWETKPKHVFGVMTGLTGKEKHRALFIT